MKAIIFTDSELELKDYERGGDTMRRITVVMTPFEYDSNGVRLLGTSDLLTVSATLPNSNQNVISNSPKNNPDTSVYTVGVESENGENGLSAGLSASTTITKTNLTVTNKSNHYLKKGLVKINE